MTPKNQSPRPSPFEFIGPHRESLRVTFGALEFEGVVLRAFPLRANLNRLTTFCDRYLNSDIPEDIAHFKPAAPYVMMMVLNYGRMADTASNMGWVAQNEVFFGVPLVGKWNEDGRIIRGPAVVTPFIFVDNEWSMATGREVYGWPKMPVWLEPGLNSWLRDPRAPRRLMTLKTLAMGELYENQRAAAQTLVEIEQEPHLVFGQAPPNLDYLLQPLLRLPKAIADTLSAAPDFLQSLSRAFQLVEAPDLPEFISGAFKGLAEGGPSIFGNTINLKQFRASSHPGSVCYQALVNSRMQIKRYNGGGMMGSVDLLRGDPSAGFSIYVHQLPAYPIIESLGIEVERTRVRDGVSVAELRPMLPFWASLDMRYERGRRICWRGYDTSWRAWWGVDRPDKPIVASFKVEQAERTIGEVLSENSDSQVSKLEVQLRNTSTGKPTKCSWDFGDGAPLSNEKEPTHKYQFPGEYEVTLTASNAHGGDTTRHRIVTSQDRSPRKRTPSLNTTLGPVVAAPQGPFDFYDVSLRVLPIRADSACLEKLLPDLSSAQDLEQFSLFQASSGSDAYVFLVITSYGEMSSTANDIGWWAKNDVSIITPVVWGTWIWQLWLYSFSDSPIAVTEGREVLGLPSAYARISEGADPWLRAAGVGKDRQLLTVSTMDYPATGVGQQASEQRLIEVNRRGDDWIKSQEREQNAKKQGGQTQSSWIERLREGVLAKHQKHGIKLHNLSLKEFRDEERPDKPCYQALVASASELGELAESASGAEAESIRIEPLPGDYTVTFTSTPSWPIVEKLGLRHRAVRSDGSSPVAVCDVFEPFWIRTNIRAHLSEVLAKREIGSKDWVQVEDAPQIIKDVTELFDELFRVESETETPEERSGFLLDVLDNLSGSNASSSPETPEPKIARQAAVSVNPSPKKRRKKPAKRTAKKRPKRGKAP